MTKMGLSQEQAESYLPAGYGGGVKREVVSMG